MYQGKLKTRRPRTVNMVNSFLAYHFIAADVRKHPLPSSPLAQPETRPLMLAQQRAVRTCYDEGGHEVIDLTSD